MQVRFTASSPVHPPHTFDWHLEKPTSGIRGTAQGGISPGFLQLLHAEEVPAAQFRGPLAWLSDTMGPVKQQHTSSKGHQPEPSQETAAGQQQLAGYVCRQLWMPSGPEGQQVQVPLTLVHHTSLSTPTPTPATCGLGLGEEATSMGGQGLLMPHTGSPAPVLLISYGEHRGSMWGVETSCPQAPPSLACFPKVRQ